MFNGLGSQRGGQGHADSDDQSSSHEIGAFKAKVGNKRKTRTFVRVDMLLPNGCLDMRLDLLYEIGFRLGAYQFVNYFAALDKQDGGDAGDTIVDR
jgi:hypothetical protein